GGTVDVDVDADLAGADGQVPVGVAEVVPAPPALLADLVDGRDLTQAGGRLDALEAALEPLGARDRGAHLERRRLPVARARRPGDLLDLAGALPDRRRPDLDAGERFGEHRGRDHVARLAAGSALAISAARHLIAGTVVEASSVVPGRGRRRVGR